MTWVKIDDQFADHPKFVGLSDSAIALWTKALAYSNRHLTDGFIPAASVPGMTKSRKPFAVAQELLDVSLWQEGTKGYNFHDFHDWNDSAETIRARREMRREVARRGGLASGQVRQGPTEREHKSKQVASGSVPGRLVVSSASVEPNANGNELLSLSSPTPTPDQILEPKQKLSQPGGPAPGSPPPHPDPEVGRILAELRKHQSLDLVADEQTAQSLFGLGFHGGKLPSWVDAAIAEAAHDSIGLTAELKRQKLRKYVSAAKPPKAPRPGKGAPNVQPRGEDVADWGYRRTPDPEGASK